MTRWWTSLARSGAVLALLAAAEGRAGATADILDALWPGGCRTRHGPLQSHVSRLRGHLGLAAVLLEGLSGAYRLRLDAAGSGTDVARARSLLATAAGADPADARRLLAEARSLWRGVALAEFDDVGPLAALAVTLRAARVSSGPTPPPPSTPVRPTKPSRSRLDPRRR